MDIVEWVIGESTSLDVFVVVRIMLVLIAAEMAVGIAQGIGGLTKS